MAPLPLSPGILDQYRRRTPTSERLYREAREVFPSGITHDARYLLPYPPYIERAEGSRKWDVDGNEYVDYVGGHGALLLGHNHPQVVEAVQRQLVRGTHYGGCHQRELDWGRVVQRLVPSAERVRFTSSGTEATLLALRVARAATGKPKVVRFSAHFHGWQDHVAFGSGLNPDTHCPPGLLPGIVENILLCPPGDLPALHRLLTERDDIAAVIVEPTGASWGQVPLAESFLHALRELTEQRQVLLIFDEVISGFRCSPGGAQACLQIQPDLTTLAKILAGGFPGGALVGRRPLLDWLDYQASESQGREKIPHHGTFNANPVSAAAGTAALELVATRDVCQRASHYAAQLREELARVVQQQGAPWCVYGSFSGFHIFTNPDREPVTAEQIQAGQFDWRKLKAAAHCSLAVNLRLGMLAHGADIFAWPGGPTSAVHTPEDLDHTADALRQTLKMMKTDGLI